MEKIIVRAVDSGNIQRSPTFQAIFNHAISMMDDLPFDLEFDSAGMDVDKIIDNTTPALKKLSILDAGLYYDLIEGREKDLVQELIETWSYEKEENIPVEQKNIITGLYAENKTKVHTIQMEYRNKALLEAGIPKEFLPGMRNPFSHDDGPRLILPVEMPVMKKVEGYYQDHGLGGQIPRIIMYGDIVGIESLPDVLKGGMRTAREQVEYFMNTCEVAMERIVEIMLKLSS
ncbi:MAG: hypothetical protein KAS67_01520 [Thermoplasmata archaeon]|nr:hypothetical protein [Thermoplasmata archaeon]